MNYRIEIKATPLGREADLLHIRGQLLATLSQASDNGVWLSPEVEIQNLEVTSATFQVVMQGLIELADLNVKWTAATGKAASE